MDKTIGIYVLKTFVVALSLSCFYGIIFPSQLTNWVTTTWNKTGSLYISVITRLVLGSLLVWVASETNYPIAFTVFGYFTLAAAVLILISGPKKVSRLIRWFKNAPPIALRIWFCACFTLCCLIFFYGT